LEIIIEIGTDEQKAQICKELSFFEKIVSKLNLNIRITKFIIARDFDKTVNDTEKTTNYKSTRGINSHTVTAAARIIEVNNNNCIIVISPLLFTNENDTQIRYYIYFHELTHAINKQKLPKIILDHHSINIYNYHLYLLFDEYYSDRFSYNLIQEIYNEPSKLWLDFIKREIGGFNELINDAIYSEMLKKEIINFRLHKINVTEYLENIKCISDTISKAIVHSHALVDQYPDCNAIIKPDISKFINKKTMQIIQYYRMKYLQNNFDLSDGLYLIEDYLTNFGMRLEDTPKGLYCHILDV